jgi:hypothetical protein
MTKPDLIQLAEVLKGKTPLRDRQLYAMAGRWGNRYGVDLCAEVFQNMQDMNQNKNCIALIEKVLQITYIERNPQRDTVLTDLTMSMGR